MHITLWLTSNDISTIRLPSANLHLFQSMLYSILPPEEAANLHDKGFNSDAMSWPVAASRPQFGDNTVIFPLPLKLIISTPLQNLISGFSCASRILRIGNNYVECSKVEIEQQKVNSDNMIIKTLSPITCYSSTEKNGRQYTKYLSPYDDEFQKSICFNLTRKFRLLYDDKILDDNFKIIPLGNLKERISMFEKNGSFPIKGWWGKFRLEGDKDLLQTALDCGLGAKNSAGWGCITKC